MPSKHGRLNKDHLLTVSQWRIESIRITRRDQAAQALFSAVPLGQSRIFEHAGLTTVEPSAKRINDEVRAIEAVSRKRPASRQAALGFLKRIGADGWPNSPTKGIDFPEVRRKKQ
jgi:hypothetical protein